MGRRQVDDDDEDEVSVTEIPHDVVNEQIVIAAALTCKKRARKDLISTVPIDLFVDPQHIDIWTGLKEIARRKLKFDMAALLHQLGSEFDQEYLTELVESHPKPPANLAHHVASLRWDKARSETVKGPLTDLLRSLQDPTTPQEKITALSRSVTASLSVSTDKRFMRDPTALAREHTTAMRKRKKQAIYPFGIPDLDMDDDGNHRMMPGIAPNYVTVVTGVPGSAKSVITARIVLAQARAKRKVLYGAWEMGAGPTIEMLALMSLTDEDPTWTRYKTSTGRIKDDQFEMFEQRMEDIGAYVKFFDPPFKSAPTKRDHRGQVRRATNEECLDILHQQIADSGCEVFAGDLFERAIKDRRPDQEADALFRMQDIAKETHTHVLMVAQQRLKDIEQRTDKRPTREGIKGSGAWVEVADTIIGLHRPALWKSMNDDVIEVLVLKQRFAKWPYLIEFDWDGDRVSIKNGREGEYEHPGAADESPFGRIGKKR
jgi:replicative DNA helicase